MIKTNKPSIKKNVDLATVYAKEIWEKYDLSIPVDLDKVANMLGIDIYERPFINEIDGLYMCLPKKATIIAINNSPHKAVSRRRFTIAHEIAHHFLTLKPSPKEKIFCLDSQRARTTILEKACDRFATMLLMPKDLIIKNFEELSENEENRLEIMSERFGVSICAMQRRVTELGLMKRTFRRLSKY